MSSIIIEQPLLNALPIGLEQQLDPIFVEYYNKYNVGRLATHQIPIEQYRKNPSKYNIIYGRADGVEVYRISEQKCLVDGGQIKIRIFEGKKPEENTRPQSAYVNFHAGGWTFGGLASDDSFCRYIASEIECVVFDVEYRLAPEFPYPTAIEDGWAALKWVREEKAKDFNIDLDSIAVGGTSAGGHIAAVIAHMARDAGISLAFQLLATPCVDLRWFTTNGENIRADCPYESYREMADAPILSVERLIYVSNSFLGLPKPHGLQNEWRISPIVAPNFNGLAPALIVTAEIDPLRDEGEAYGEKMNQGGSKCTVHRYRGVPHAFMMFDGILQSGRVFNREAVQTLKGVFEKPHEL